MSGPDEHDASTLAGILAGGVASRSQCEPMQQPMVMQFRCSGLKRNPRGRRHYWRAHRVPDLSEDSSQEFLAASSHLLCGGGFQDPDNGDEWCVIRASHDHCYRKRRQRGRLLAQQGSSWLQADVLSLCHRICPARSLHQRDRMTLDGRPKRARGRRDSAIRTGRLCSVAGRCRWIHS